MSVVYLSLGSNQQAEQHLKSALKILEQQFGRLVISPWYRTKAIGFCGSDFLNLAVSLQTTWPIEKLHQWLHDLEDQHGRKRDVPRFSNRTLDIDIVLFDMLIYHGENNLCVPRSELLKHAFVLKPMVDIAQEVWHPTENKALSAIWEAFPETEKQCIKPWGGDIH